MAALGSDGNSDTAPSTTEGIGFPIHVLALNAMGVHLLDYLQFEDLAAALRARAAAGSSCSSPRRCASSAGPARRSTRSRSSDARGGRADRSAERSGERCLDGAADAVALAWQTIPRNIERKGLRPRFAAFHRRSPGPSGLWCSA